MSHVKFTWTDRHELRFYLGALKLVVKPRKHIRPVIAAAEDVLAGHRAPFDAHQLENVPPKKFAPSDTASNHMIQCTANMICRIMSRWARLDVIRLAYLNAVYRVDGEDAKRLGRIQRCYDRAADLAAAIVSQTKDSPMVSVNLLDRAPADVRAALAVQAFDAALQLSRDQHDAAVAAMLSNNFETAHYILTHNVDAELANVPTYTNPNAELSLFDAFLASGWRVDDLWRGEWTGQLPLIKEGNRVTVLRLLPDDHAAFNTWLQQQTVITRSALTAVGFTTFRRCNAEGRANVFAFDNGS